MVLFFWSKACVRAHVFSMCACTRVYPWNWTVAYLFLSFVEDSHDSCFSSSSRRTLLMEKIQNQDRAERTKCSIFFANRTLTLTETTNNTKNKKKVLLEYGHILMSRRVRPLTASQPRPNGQLQLATYGKMKITNFASLSYYLSWSTQGHLVI
jgi:hypothetical protein